MAGTARDWRIGLVEAHPRLFHTPAARPEAAWGYAICEKGWRDLPKRACARIGAAIAEESAFRSCRSRKAGHAPLLLERRHVRRRKGQRRGSSPSRGRAVGLRLRNAERKASFITVGDGWRPRAANYTRRAIRCRPNRLREPSLGPHIRPPARAIFDRPVPPLHSEKPTRLSTWIRRRWESRSSSMARNRCRACRKKRHVRL
jgi:hypothetical protein